MRRILYALTITLALCGASEGADAPDIVLKRVPPGWTGDGKGYFLNAAALSALAGAAKTYRLERDEWEAAYRDMSEKAIEIQKALQSQLDGLRNELDAEREAWRSSIRKARQPGFGAFAGAGYSGHGVEAVIGVGFVWKIF
jgi:CHASE1-domain containing sensor protein